MIGILITTVGISLLTLGLVGASLQVYSQLLSAMVQQQISGLTQQLPSILQPEGSAPAGGAEPASGSTQILLSLIENLMNTPNVADHLGTWYCADLPRFVCHAEAEAQLSTVRCSISRRL